MSSYIAKAFIATPTEDVKVPLMYQLKDLGYRENVLGVIGQDTHLTIIKGHLQGLVPNDTEDYIDCNAYTPNGTEEEAVKLFLELAQMDDDDAATIWVKVERPMEQAWGNVWVQTSYHKNYASSSELIKAVCKGWVKNLSPQQFAEAYKAKNIVL